MASPSTTPIVPIFARLTWMFVGPMAFVLFTFAIVSKGGGWLTGFDFGFAVVLTAMLISRWLEFHTGHPETATGEPATEQRSTPVRLGDRGNRHPDLDHRQHCGESRTCSLAMK